MMRAALPVLRRDAIHAGLAALEAGEGSPPLSAAYASALEALPFGERVVVADTIGAVQVMADRMRNRAHALRAALVSVVGHRCGGDICGACAGARALL